MSEPQKPRFRGDAVVTFEDVPLALAAERALKAAGIENRLVAPPPQLRLGCALGVEILMAHSDAVVQLLKDKNIPYSKLLPLGSL